MLADLNTRHASLDGLELSAVRSPRLGIKRIQVARTAVHPEEDAVLRLRRRFALRMRNSRVQPLRHQHAEQPAHSDLHKPAPVQCGRPQIYRSGAAAKLSTSSLLLQIQQLVIFFASRIV